jgi:hypothetical protein
VKTPLQNAISAVKVPFRAEWRGFQTIAKYATTIPTNNGVLNANLSKTLGMCP